MRTRNKTMDKNTAYAYRLDDNYTPVYVNLNGYEQIIFYWSIANDAEKRKPKWRVTKETIEQGMKIGNYNSLGFFVEIEGKRAYFEWYEYNNAHNNPAHKAKLVNFGDWESTYDPAYKNNSPTSSGNHYSGLYVGSYIQPEYDAESDPFYMEE